MSKNSSLIVETPEENPVERNDILEPGSNPGEEIWWMEVDSTKNDFALYFYCGAKENIKAAYNNRVFEREDDPEWFKIGPNMPARAIAAMFAGLLKETPRASLHQNLNLRLYSLDRRKL